MDDVAPPAIKLSNAKHHASLLSSLFFENSIDFGVDESISFQSQEGIQIRWQLLAWVVNTIDLWTPISRVLENICTCLKF